MLTRLVHPAAFLFFLALCAACNQTPVSEPTDSAHVTTIRQLADSLQTVFAPDKRVALFDLNVAENKDTITLTGVTDQPAAHAALIAELEKDGIMFVDSIRILPDPALGDRTFGVVRQSVANLRSQMGHSQELATQAVLGTPLRVLEKDPAGGDWYRVQTPDGYIAWLDGGGFQPLGTAQMSGYQTSNRVLFNGDFGLVRSLPTAAAPVLLDLVPGSLLVQIGNAGPYTQVKLPDGRRGYLPSDQPITYERWTAERPFSVPAILATADRLSGRPYLWGGTSAKGMDCSGFTKTVYRLNGLIIPRDASQQVHVGTEVALNDSLTNLQPGDFLFFGNLREDGSQRITHVGIYTGNGNFIHAGADNGATATNNLLPGRPLYAEHRRKSLLRAKRLRPDGQGVMPIAQSGWY
ncbi:MAG: SH3 domain-containing C40 family peptidase [Saprospiraceae bacterium]